MKMTSLLRCAILVGTIFVGVGAADAAYTYSNWATRITPGSSGKTARGALVNNDFGPSNGSWGVWCSGSNCLNVSPPGGNTWLIAYAHCSNGANVYSSWSQASTVYAYCGGPLDGIAASNPLIQVASEGYTTFTY